MRASDLWFQAGDKVIRVSGTPSWIKRTGRCPTWSGPVRIPEYGAIYCVEDFYEGAIFNAIMLVGFGGWRREGSVLVGFPAAAFRKVEEIQICIAAARHMSDPVFPPDLIGIDEA